MSVENVSQNLADAKTNIKEAVEPSRQTAEHLGSAVNYLIDAMELTNQLQAKLRDAGEAYKRAGVSQEKMTELVWDGWSGLDRCDLNNQKNFDSINKARRNKYE